MNDRPCRGCDAAHECRYCDKTLQRCCVDMCRSCFRYCGPMDVRQVALNQDVSINEARYIAYEEYAADMDWMRN